MLWKIAKAGGGRTVAFAAQELKKYITQMDGTQEVAILRYDAYRPEAEGVLWLGVCPEVAARVREPEYDDAIDIRVKDGAGSIRGSNPRSVLIGVYRFLRELGCAWVRPGAGGEIVPKRALNAVDVALAEIPSYRHRAVCIEGAVNYDHVADMIDWLPKAGMNGYFNQFNNPYCFYDRWYSAHGTKLTSAEVAGIKAQTVDEIRKRGMMYHEAGHGWTCEPFGIPGETWEKREYSITDEQKRVLAEVNGKRGLWGGIPLNTNLCYSNPAVRARIADAVVERCLTHPEIDFVQIWLADGTNNHCECAECVKMRPADWYVRLLNEVDSRMTAAGLRQKVVFLIYVDLLWPPEKEDFNDPDRFVLMFAPITRTYARSMADRAPFDEADLPPYERNRLRFPHSVEENLAWLKKWQARFGGDSFDFDYHFMWDHFKDPGYYHIAQVLFKDMQGLHGVGLNGMVSCQCQRVWFPSGLGMHAMAAALWDEHCDFDAVADRCFADAFGKDGARAKDYLRELSDAFHPLYGLLEGARADAETVRKFMSIPEILDRNAGMIRANADDPSLAENVRLSWRYLACHAQLCGLLAELLAAFASGDRQRMAEAGDRVAGWAQTSEKDIAPVFDAFEFTDVLRRLAQMM